jgi:hypothetical protein
MPSRSAHARACALLATAVATTLLASASPTEAAAAGNAASAAAKRASDATPYAFKSTSWGSRVRGGDLPVSSGTTSYQGISCTNRTGVTKDNSVATVQLPGLGTIEGVKATNATSGSGDDVASWSTHDIGAIKLAQSALGSLTIKAVSTESKAWHDASGYHAATSVDVGRISLVTPLGPVLDLPLPKPGAPVEVPGLLRISVGKEKHVVGASGAKAKAEGLVIKVLPTGTKVQVAHTVAKVSQGVKRGLFSGKANATQVEAAAGLVKSGPQPLMKMPCQGTRGDTRASALADLELAGLVSVKAAGSSLMGQSTGQYAAGWTRAEVASVDLGNGALVLDGIVAQANVSRRGSHVSANSNGTTVGSITVGGTPYSLEQLSGLELPGLARVETDVTTRTPSGIDVVAVRLTLLNGTGAVVDLGHAALRIGPSGLKAR